MRKRKLDKLVSGETEDGGKLKETATRKADESILIQIADRINVVMKIHIVP